MPGGRITDEDIQKVRDASDIVAVFSERVPVKQRGRDFWCCCPFHNEKSPSCKIDPALQLWHCFGCGEGGDVFAFIMKAEDLSFPEAVHRLAERAHIDIVEVGGKPAAPASKKARLKDICKATAEFYHLQLMRLKSPEASAAREYLSGRDLGGKVPHDWNLGFAPGRGVLTRHLSSKGFKADEMVEANVCSRDSQGKLRDRFYNRIMFPINDVAGDCIAFGGRVVGKGEPKYLNSQETPLFHKSQVLYGLDKAKVAMASSGVAIVCEGYTDVIALHEGGVRNAVATLGTALTMRHIRILGRHAQKKIVYLFDGDAAGQKAADRALEFIDSSMTPEAGKTRIELCAVTLPDNLDPAEYMASHSAAELEELIEHAQPLLKYGIDRRLAAHRSLECGGQVRRTRIGALGACSHQGIPACEGLCYPNCGAYPCPRGGCARGSLKACAPRSLRRSVGRGGGGSSPRSRPRSGAPGAFEDRAQPPASRARASQRARPKPAYRTCPRGLPRADQVARPASIPPSRRASSIRSCPTLPRALR